jgi:hypothetical protein
LVEKIMSKAKYLCMNVLSTQTMEISLVAISITLLVLFTSSAIHVYAQQGGSVNAGSASGPGATGGSVNAGSASGPGATGGSVNAGSASGPGATGGSVNAGSAIGGVGNSTSNSTSHKSPF